ncbi:protein angel homolog 2 isoform X2 [Scophthalmus maximus]|nr:protein angel homolog 2 isoform X2 [Scophthalmus maximus]XP_047184359.1 protein angel homolog 2 isoform X2 [Scophthalmus maximus]XP_047184360.1 protein angel homolog 2 isoform X2 [Scophthalmus maximus]XP_047184361.1 protein angel homolog 2 isoform X2 [Scophthalmus maximus]
MFLRQLSSFGSSFFPRSYPALSRAGFGSGGASSSSSSTCFPPFVPVPHPWWSVQGFPPWPPRLPPSYHPTTARHNIDRGNNFGGGSRRSFHASAGLLMERPDRDREPPHKRRKREEEKRRDEERGGGGGGGGGGGAAPKAAGGKVKEGNSRRDSRVDSSSSSPRPNHHLRDGGQDRGKKGAGEVWGNSRDRDFERTKRGNKERERKDSGSRDRGGNHWRSRDRTEGRKDPQPAGTRTQTPKSKPKPNPWFREGGAEQQGGNRTNTKAAEEQPRDGSGGGLPRWTGSRSQPSSSSSAPHPPNPWQVAGADRQPPPPGTFPSDEGAPGKSLQRHWETSPACGAYPPPPGAAFDFSVMSYNILSQELLQDNAYLYRHCDPGVLPWEHRLPNLLAEIRQHGADILCLQEVQEDHYENQMKPALHALGYQCEYKKRTGSKPDGCAVIFNSSRLSLVSSNPVEFFRPGDALLNRDNVGLVVLLRPNDNDPSSSAGCICIANTHLLYNPRRGDVKLAQLAILLAEVGRLSRLPDGSAGPVVLCGDFNSTPGSPLYRFLTTGRLDYRGLPISTVSGQENAPKGQRVLESPIWSRSLGINHRCQYEDEPTAEAHAGSPTAVEEEISNLTVDDLATKSAAAVNRVQIEHSLKLQSSYQHRLLPDGRPEITTCHSRTAITVDYILFTPESPAAPSCPGGRGLRLLGRLSLVGRPELEEVNFLPNRHHSSDHLPLLARFRFGL